MDVGQQESLSLEEIAIPHITLGVSSDSEFIKLVMNNINPSKFATEQDFNEKRMTLREFTQVFKKDIVSERLTE